VSRLPTDQPIVYQLSEINEALLYCGADRAKRNLPVATQVNLAIREITTRLNGKNLIEAERPIIEALLCALRLQYVVLLTTDMVLYAQKFDELRACQIQVQQLYQSFLQKKM
jgi:hypothetical protein